MARSDFRSIEVFICISLLNLHKVSARAHLSSEELEGEEMGSNMVKNDDFSRFFAKIIKNYQEALNELPGVL